MTSLIPITTVALEMPELIDNKQAVARAYTEAGKKQLDVEITRHHRKHVPRHFRQGNRGRYGHFKRARATKFIKARRGYGRTDLVETRVTRDVFVAGWKRKQIGGRVNPDGSGGTRATIYFRFPFPFADGRRRVTNQGQVTPRKMALELEAWSEDEIQETTERFAQGVIRRLGQIMRRRRVSKKSQKAFSARFG